MSLRSSFKAFFVSSLKAICLLVWALLLVYTHSNSAAFAQNREDITNYEVAIAINKDRSVEITEVIDVMVLGRSIKRGLLRDIPVRYRDKANTELNIDLEILGIKRDGEAEPYQLSYKGRYARLKIGRASHLLKHGMHRYEIRYKVSDSIGFFEKFDEIYWNAIGNEWPFYIKKAKASVLLPEGAEIGQFSVYTGRIGANGSDFTVGHRTERSITFHATREFRPKEGMSVAVAWQKGIVDAPTEAERAEAWLTDNAPLFVLILAAMAEMGWLYWAWNKVGRDPKGGAIIPRFRPPADISPALASYIIGVGDFAKNSQVSFMAGLVSLAIKGFLKIENSDKLSVRRLIKSDDGKTNDLPVGERAIMSNLLGSRETATFEGMTFKTMSAVMSAFTNGIHRETDEVYFNRNTGYMIPAFLFAVIGIIGFIAASIIFAAPYQVPIFELIIAVVALIVFGIMAVIYRLIRGKAKLKMSPLIVGGFVIFFFSQILLDQNILSSGPLANINWLAVLCLVAIVAALPIFMNLMKAPTKLGREMMDEIEGLELFMTVTVAEQADHAYQSDQPELTPELYEDLLPYAIALGVEEKWSKVFEDKVFSQLPPEKAYNPRWYHGRSFNPARPTAALAGMTATLGTDLASAMTPPASSSSGSGGGGFSGGGGGGGGGW